MCDCWLAAVRFLRDDDGVTAVEYGLIVALLSLAVIVTLTAVNHQIDGLYLDICTRLKLAVHGTVDCSTS